MDKEKKIMKEGKKLNTHIFWLEGIGYLQVIRLDGTVEIYSLEKDKVEVKTPHKFVLLRERFGSKSKGTFMCAKEVEKDERR